MKRPYGAVALSARYAASHARWWLIAQPATPPRGSQRPPPAHRALWSAATRRDSVGVGVWVVASKLALSRAYERFAAASSAATDAQLSASRARLSTVTGWRGAEEKVGVGGGASAVDAVRVGAIVSGVRVLTRRAAKLPFGNFKNRWVA